MILFDGLATFSVGAVFDQKFPITAANNKTQPPNIISPESTIKPLGTGNSNTIVNITGNVGVQI